MTHVAIDPLVVYGDARPAHGHLEVLAASHGVLPPVGEYEGTLGVEDEPPLRVRLRVSSGGRVDVVPGHVTAGRARLSFESVIIER